MVYRELFACVHVGEGVHDRLLVGGAELLKHVIERGEPVTALYAANRPFGDDEKFVEGCLDIEDIARIVGAVCRADIELLGYQCDRLYCLYGFYRVIDSIAVSSIAVLHLDQQGSRARNRTLDLQVFRHIVGGVCAGEVRHLGNVDTLLVTEHFGGDVMGVAGDGGIEVDLLYQGYDMVELSGRFGEV